VRDILETLAETRMTIDLLKVRPREAMLIMSFQASLLQYSLEIGFKSTVYHVLVRRNSRVGCDGRAFGVRSLRTLAKSSAK